MQQQIEKIPSNLLSASEIAAILGGHVKRIAVYTWIRRGKLPATKLAGRWLVRPADLNRFLGRKVVAE